MKMWSNVALTGRGFPGARNPALPKNRLGFEPNHQRELPNVPFSLVLVHVLHAPGLRYSSQAGYLQPGKGHFPFILSYHRLGLKLCRRLARETAGAYGYDSMHKAAVLQNVEKRERERVAKLFFFLEPLSLSSARYPLCGL